MQFQIRIALIFLAAAIGSNASAADSADSKAKGMPPPEKWDARVTDTFFPDARETLVGPRPDWKRTAASKSGDAGGDGTSTAAGAFAWSKIISADTLQDEVKSQGPALAEEVKTPQVFVGGANKKARQTLSLLAATFAIINEYDGDVKWKKQAAGARDLFARAGFNCKAATDNTFKETKMRSEDLAAMLRGESITVPAGAEPKNDWDKIANLAPLMNRLENAQQNRIAPATSNAGDFKKNAAQIVHESEIVAALAEAISRPGMENAEDEKFVKYAKALQKSGLDVRQAVNDSNYDAARTAAGVMKKSCDNCHGDFR